MLERKHDLTDTELVWPMGWMWECILSFTSVCNVNEAFLLSFLCYRLLVKQSRKLCICAMSSTIGILM